MFARLASWLIARAQRTPYFHLHHADGSLYMERWWLVPFPVQGSAAAAGCYRAGWRQPLVWLFQRLGIAVRVHHICTADLDREMHDHPWTWMSVVLRGWYREALPISNSYHQDGDQFVVGVRDTGSVGVRHFWQRHRVVDVSTGGAWTLFITFRKRQSWGFYTPQGKVWWWQFESVHNAYPVEVPK